MYSKEYAEIAATTLPNMVEYCSRHGYKADAIVLENGEDWPYKKHERIRELFNEGADVVWYRDIDLIITNMNYTVQDVLFPVADFGMYITKDYNELNGGSIVMVNNEHGRTLNDLILHHRNEYDNEQNLYNALKDTLPFSEDMKIISQQRLNAYRYDLYPECQSHVGEPSLGDWAEGELSFVLHVPALPLNQRLEVLRNAKITR
jgi:hypothetical protein